MEEQNSVLVVTPHPDDAESGAGGTIAKWTKEGRKVVLVVCTDGSKGTSDRNVRPEDLAKTREAEQLEAARVLGISEVVFLRFPDQGLEDCSEFREKIVRQIRKHRPQTVVTIDPNRKYIRHRDHAMCGRVTLDACFPYARDVWAYPEHFDEGLEPHKVREVLLWGSDEPDLFLDVTETFEIKIKALYKHASQLGEPTEERLNRARSRYGDVGKKIGVPLAEQFKRIEITR
ncbi:MAG: PIG-L family deacetylase [Chloroflexi bacterium]|nr:PIG-L family deacetylase [Chloroflexota bacterium]